MGLTPALHGATMNLWNLEQPSIKSLRRAGLEAKKSHQPVGPAVLAMPNRFKPVEISRLVLSPALELLGETAA